MSLNKQQHEKWLKKYGADKATIRNRKLQLGSPYTEAISRQVCSSRWFNSSLGNTIPENGRKSSDSLFKEKESMKYPTMPAYNKGPVMVVSKEEIPYAGRK